jgi:hypothetical protein
MNKLNTFSSCRFCEIVRSILGAGYMCRPCYRRWRKIYGDSEEKEEGKT